MIRRWEDWEAQIVAFLNTVVEAADMAHDTLHIQRVVANARYLAEQERAELAVVLPAAYLHDCVALSKQSPLRAQASRLSGQRAASFLTSIGYPAEHIGEIEHAIAAHSFSARIVPTTLAAKVVQDADRLDALGAVGVARTILVGAARSAPLYDSAHPFPAARQADDRNSIVDHFFVKLLHLQSTMQTETGRREAAQRTAFMLEYLRELAREVGRSAELERALQQLGTQK
jgi:uncharacterized protein